MMSAPAPRSGAPGSLAGLRLSGRAAWQGPDKPAAEVPGRAADGVLSGANYVLFPTVQVNALVGYQQQDVQRDVGTVRGTGRGVGTNVALPWGFTVGASVEFRWTDYETGGSRSSR